MLEKILNSCFYCFSQEIKRICWSQVKLWEKNNAQIQKPVTVKWIFHKPIGNYHRVLSQLVDLQKRIRFQLSHPVILPLCKDKTILCQKKE